jgi:hypothetical protein
VAVTALGAGTVAGTALGVVAEAETNRGVVAEAKTNLGVVAEAKAIHFNLWACILAEAALRAGTDIEAEATIWDGTVAETALGAGTAETALGAGTVAGTALVVVAEAETNLEDVAEAKAIQFNLWACILAEATLRAGTDIEPEATIWAGTLAETVLGAGTVAGTALGAVAEAKSIHFNIWVCILAEAALGAGAEVETNLESGT